MTKKTRTRILVICIVAFLIGVPYIVLYSLGYRVDFVRMKIFATGGIYVRTFPAADQIIIDSKNFIKLGIFSNEAFVPNLLPIDHSVLIKKSGYYDYSKVLPVQEKLATKLENVSLFKKDLTFTEVIDVAKSPFLPANQQEYIIKNSNLYYSVTAQNANLTTLQKNTALIKGILAFSMQNNNIIWLGTDGFLYQLDTNSLPMLIGTMAKKLTKTAIKTNTSKTAKYKIIIDNKNTFLNNNSELLLLNTKTQNLEKFAEDVKDAKISPDGKYIVYFTPNEVFMTSLSQDPEDPLSQAKNVSLYKSNTNINDLFWLNDSYIIFTTGNNIIISEIDYRGNINSVTLPDSAKLTDSTTIAIASPKIIYKSEENKLYISTAKSVLTLDKVMP